MSVPSSANERAAEPDASTTTSPAGRLGRSHQMCAVERDEVGAELFDRPPACAFRGRKEHAARRPRKLGNEAVLGGDSGDERGLDPELTQRLGRPGPTAAIFGNSPRARATSSRAPFGLVTITHS